MLRVSHWSTVSLLVKWVQSHCVSCDAQTSSAKAMPSGCDTTVLQKDKYSNPSLYGFDVDAVWLLLLTAGWRRLWCCCMCL